ncbi:MAG TPA: STAS domain-containing protein [Candidatus Nitrosotenuis sp.]|nr:STAS domain-containing protein [Candidatus Nitrosotenuis sp.]
MELEFAIAPGPPATVVRMRGDLDLAGVNRIKPQVEKLLEQSRVRLIYDMRELSHIDSTGLGFLVWSRKRVRDQGGTLNLVISQPGVQRLLEITGLLRLFDIYGDIEEALEAVPRDEG